MGEIHDILVSTESTVGKLGGLFEDCTRELCVVNSKKVKRLHAEIIGIAKTLYLSNFDSGVDVDRFKESNILAFSALGAIVGAGLGFGVDYLIRM